MVTLITIPALLGMGLAVIFLNTPPASPTSPSPEEQLVQTLEIRVAPALAGQVEHLPLDQKSLTIWAIPFRLSPAQFGLNGAGIDEVALLDHQGQVLTLAPEKRRQISPQ